MKKNVTIRGLQEYCNTHKPRIVQFTTENQGWNWAVPSCQVNLSFQAMSVYESPNSVFLKSSTSSMLIDRVKFAEIDTERTVLGTVVTLFCGDRNISEQDATYRLILA